ncbi:ATP-dependent DNA/RNA helicase DHX36-like, partial [Plectropomus leopardus]|uniref:ATP-dependent DNA/RNA helicase DHX36-like n=1 Tax=Plectropomus leopardus TaxID=160734 RepID=UPI001C4A9DC9
RAVVQMDEAREQHITKLLNSVQNDQPGAGRDGRDARASTSDSWRTAHKSSGHCYFDGDAPEEDKLKTEFKSEEEEEEVSPGQMKASQTSQRNFSQAVVKDEPPDAWDDEEEQEKEEKEKLRRNDKDLEFLFQEVVRDSSLDDRLKRDLQSKKSDPKYNEML